MPNTSNPDFLVFTGKANPELAEEVVKCLGTTLGKIQVDRFSDGEVTVEIMQNVRARDVFIIQPTCAPTNDALMELLIMVDASNAHLPNAFRLSSLTSATPDKTVAHALPAYPFPLKS